MGKVDRVNNTDAIMGMMATGMRQNMPIRESDYTNEQGYITCGKCGKPKERDVTVSPCGETITYRMPIACNCDSKGFADEQERKRRDKVEDMRRRFVSEELYRGHRFECDDSPDSFNSTIARKYAAKWDEMFSHNKGLLMTGTIGTGKSFYACCVANALIDNLCGAMVTTISKLKARLGNFNDKGDVLTDIAEIPLLVLDDFGTESGTATSLEQINTIIDTRYKSGKPLIITTNLTVEQMPSAENIPPRAVDRIFQMCQIQLDFKGSSRRIDIAERSRQEMYRLLAD